MRRDLSLVLPLAAAAAAMAMWRPAALFDWITADDEPAAWQGHIEIAERPLETRSDVGGSVVGTARAADVPRAWPASRAGAPRGAAVSSGAVSPTRADEAGWRDREWRSRDRDARSY